MPVSQNGVVFFNLFEVGLPPFFFSIVLSPFVPEVGFFLGGLFFLFRCLVDWSHALPTARECPFG